MAELVYLKDVKRDPNSVVTVGTFDGVHAGHRAIMDTVLKRASERKARSVIITFNPHPREIINPGGGGIELLTTLQERRRHVGCDPFRPRLLTSQLGGVYPRHYIRANRG